MDILHVIYNNLQQGKVYGYNFTNVRFPYFIIVLCKNGRFICWSNYGSSANKNTIKELEWIITVIFKCTPEEFVAKYECK